MKGRTGHVVLFLITMLFISCVSTPEAPQSSIQVDEPTTQSSTASEKREGPAGNPLPETAPPLTQAMSEQNQSLSEPPALFPEASAIPVQPGSSRKNPPIVLPVPETPAAASGDKNGLSTGTAATKPNGAASGSQTVTVQKNAPAGAAAGTATGSAASADKKSTPVDPKTLKAPEPQTENKVVQEQPTIPVGGIPELPSKTNPALTEEKVVLSRSVRATVGQLVEIPYQGAGWVYLGEVAGKKGLAYDSRRLDPDGQTFVFRCEGPGTYTVKFFKQDFIKDYIINDYVEVVVGESPVQTTAVSGAFSLPVDRGRVVANPRWPASAGTASSATTAPVTSSTASPSAAAPATAASTAQAVPVAASTPSTAGTAPASAATASTTAATINTPSSATASATPSAAATTSTTPSAAVGSSATTPTVTTGSAVTTAAGATTAVSPAATAIAATTPATASGATTVSEPPLESLTQPEEFINRAKKEVSAGQYAAALATLQAFTAQYPAGSDEAWWLFGQIFEAKGPQRDIKSAVSYYKRLTSEYPQSQRYDEAQQRIAYLERFYFDIR